MHLTNGQPLLFEVKEMLHTETLTLNKDFRRLYKNGKSLVHSAVVIYYSKNKLQENRIGITVSKKIGKAVIRNRVKRIITEAYRLLENELPIGYDFVFVARGRASRLKSTDMFIFMRSILKNEKLIKEL